ncbi:hypothetical protein O3Q58_004614 [Salmonella enterica]|uniref:hypothetical protein n=1 Tax=Salmonella enterica TaxID=28901 RepID=UPI001478B3C0|nr:hypothetical protein [Salmonella enterica]EKG5066585.1 hypothetical protein [Salmonella enterica]
MEHRIDTYLRFPCSLKYTPWSSVGNAGNDVFSFFFLASVSGIDVSIAGELIPTETNSADCSLNAGTIISAFWDKEGGEDMRRFFTTITDFFLL